MNISIDNGVATITMPEGELFSLMKAGVFTQNVPQSESTPPPEDSSSKDLKTEVTYLLNSINLPSSLKGYGYVREAIIHCVNNPVMLRQVTKALYPTIAKDNGDVPSRVERAIRHAIERIWTPSNVEILNRLCGTNLSVEVKLTNSEFIGLLSEYVRLKIN